jgi:membrane-associated phospholipid phosphatase
MVCAHEVGVISPRLMFSARQSTTRFARAFCALLISSTSLSATRLAAQDSTARVDAGHVDKTFFTRRDAILTGIAIVGTAGLSRFDERIARWSQTPSVQGSQSRHDLVSALTHVNETPLTIGAVLTYGIGRLGGWNNVTDIGLHMTESMVLTDVTSELIRGPVGRARPRVSEDDAFNFEFGKGFTNFDNRAFPSLHSAAAFAIAASLTGEVHERHPSATWIAAPLLYGAALIPGATRIYLNHHWASDIASGAFLGTLLGAKVVHYGHTHNRTRLDRFLMGATVAPTNGGVFVGGSVSR